jgi:hypothetical protein
LRKLVAKSPPSIPFKSSDFIEATEARRVAFAAAVPLAASQRQQ